MADKRTGILTVVAGLVAGVAALFLSKKENRDLIKKELEIGEKAVTKVAKSVKKKTKAYAQKAKVKSEELVEKVKKRVTASSNKSSKPAQKTIKKFATSPALKIVGKKST